MSVCVHPNVPPVWKGCQGATRAPTRADGKDGRPMSDDDRGAGPRCLVTGATGYIGGRLVPELLAAGHRVRCLARSPGRLRDQPWTGQVEVARADVTDAGSVAAAMRDVD